jgi:Uma2 family endonuclease
MNALQVPPDLELDVTREQFEQLAIANRGLKLERAAAGRLIIVPPTGGTTGRKHLDIAAQLWWWNRQSQTARQLCPPVSRFRSGIAI